MGSCDSTDRGAKNWHIEAARVLSEEVSGMDEVVKAFFYGLDGGELRATLEAYGAKFGKGKADYARQALGFWRNGRREMSGLVAARLFELLPPLMPVPAKYKMVAALWLKSCPPSSIRLVIGRGCEPADVSCEIEGRLLKAMSHSRIPESLKGRFLWLSAGDVALREDLLNHFLDEEKKLIVSESRLRTPIIFEHFRKLGELSGRIRQEYSVGSFRLELVFDPHSTGLREGVPEHVAKPTVANAGPEPRTKPDYLIISFATLMIALWIAIFFATKFR